MRRPWPWTCSYALEPQPGGEAGTGTGRLLIAAVDMWIAKRNAASVRDTRMPLPEEGTMGENARLPVRLQRARRFGEESAVILDRSLFRSSLYVAHSGIWS